jgi:two-component system sensor histidine kinase YesM
MDYKIIKFILQPVIENSVVHGMGRQSGGIEIIIHATDTEQGLLVCISDSGLGMPEEKLAEIRSTLDMPLSRDRQEKIERIGLNNVNRRIKLNFGDAYGVSIDSREGKGTSVSILLPKIYSPR